ncbi:hypothetical protein [Tsuneonella dongtanensis]|nr:hypothetical protein [Tsuneonella dongtanensis]
MASRGDIMRPGWASAAFLIVMLGASALTMARMAVVAGLLLPSDFARYATIIATGAYLATIISFGAVEQTIKAFPRLVEDGQEGLLRGRSGAIFAVLAKRSVMVGLPALAVGLAFDVEWASDLAISAAYALVTAGMALVASLQRAMHDTRKLALGTVLRTAVVFACVVAAAWVAGVDAILAAEIGATGFVCLLSVFLFVPRSSQSADREPETEAPATGDRSGVTVFLAYGAVNVPYYLDRLYVSAVMGREVAGRYAVLALFLMFAALLVGILAQRVGPDAIRLVHRERHSRSAARHMALWIGLASAVWLLAIGGAATLFSWEGLPEGIARYAIEPDLLAPIAVSGVLLNVGLLEFLIIALDREAALLRAALGFLALVLMAAMAIALTGQGLYAMLWALAGCRLIYAALLLVALRSPPSRNKGQTKRVPTGLAQVDAITGTMDK